MWKYLFPQLRATDLGAMLRVAILGALIAGAYGVVHDQLTYSISPEYFTKLKFHQFSYANFGWGDRWFAAAVGFLATWWVGLVAGWFLARRLIPTQPRPQAYRQIATGMACVLVCALLGGAAGYAYGLWCGPDADYSSWARICRQLGIDDRWAFVRVAYIHNCGYLGGLVGLIAALVAIRPRKREADSAEARSPS